MPLISFSIEKLLPLIIEGKKTRTMRVRMKDGKINMKWERVYGHFVTAKHLNALGFPQKPIILQLWWKSRSKNRKHIFDALLENISLKNLSELTEGEWRLDGFESSEEGHRWFMKTYRNMRDMQVWIIEWDYSIRYDVARREDLL